MQLQFIDHTSPFLESVIALGKKNSSTLGLMPRDAYEQQARKHCIVVAHDGDELCGYCLFRIVETKRRIGITQLCIEPAYRRHGVGAALLDEIRKKYGRLLSGMTISCREDYESACRLWEKYGFIKKKRNRSRSAKERYLFKWWYDFGNGDLFSSTDEDGGLRVVLDLNILIKLRDQRAGDEINEEVAQILSDWLTDEVDYYFAKETLNEIHRDKNHDRTNSTILFLSEFRELVGDPADALRYIPELTQLHPGETVNHRSDRKQLAECKASNIPYFITVDDELLCRRDAIYEALGITILRPGEFIIEIDELRNRRLYEPIRLQGAQHEVKRVDSAMLLSVVDEFINKEVGERKSEFQPRVLALSSDTKHSVCSVITKPHNILIGLYGIHFGKRGATMEFVRIKKLPLGNTLFNQILVELIRSAVTRGKIIVELKEEYLNDDQRLILIRHGFTESKSTWTKICLTGTLESSELLGSCKLLGEHPELVALVDQCHSHPDPDVRQLLKLEVEKRLWPVKLKDLELPVFIIPIKPVWAAQLFDYVSANSFLFGSSPELSWSKENVYYRSINPNVEKYPGRILWYASDEKGFDRRKAIVACSYLNAITIGDAKQLFTTFRRFGIYQWKEIIRLAKDDPHGPIKVLQFSDTEVFQEPVSLDETNDILQSMDFKKQTFISPVRVNNQVFNVIYEKGKGVI